MFISALGLFMLVSGSVMVIAFWQFGFLTPVRLLLGLFCLPGVYLGMFWGNRWMHRIANETFQRIIVLVIFYPGNYDYDSGFFLSSFLNYMRQFKLYALANRENLASKNQQPPCLKHYSIILRFLFIAIDPLSLMPIFLVLGGRA